MVIAAYGPLYKWKCLNDAGEKTGGFGENYGTSGAEFPAMQPKSSEARARVDSQMLNVAVIGYGYWGPNLVRNFMELPTSTVHTVCDLQPERLELAKRRFPAIHTTTTIADVFGNPEIDAVAIATPVSSHFDLAMRALEAGKHVMVEKPLASTSKQANILVDEAAKRNRVLMVDHTFVYTGAIRKIREMIDAGDIGDAYYFDSVRVNLGLFQHDVSVLWDLAVHDLSIIDYLFASKKPRAVSATGISHVQGAPENVAYLTLFFEDNFIAHVHVNWLSPVKVRQILVGGSKKMIVFDDVVPSEKIKVYDKGIEITTRESIYQTLISYRTGDMWAPKLDMTEALALEMRHFAECCQTGATPITSGKAGARIVRILEAAEESLKSHGQPVDLNLHANG